MKILNKLIIYIHNLNKKDFEKKLTLFLGFTISIALGTTYYIYSKSNELIEEIKNIKKLTFKTMDIIKTNEKMQKEEENLQKLLEQEKDFDIKTYFEQLCSKLNIIPEGNWETKTQEFPGSDKFTEIMLNATFNNQTTKKLIEVLQTLNKNKIVYIKELIIKNKDNKKITFDITIATKKFKKNI